MAEQPNRRTEGCKHFGPTAEGFAPKQTGAIAKSDGDLEKAKTTLASVKFISRTGTAEPTGNLIAFTPKSDEGQRFAFAPDHWQLAEDYDDVAVDVSAFLSRRNAAVRRTWPNGRAEPKTLNPAGPLLSICLRVSWRSACEKELRSLDVRGTWLANGRCCGCDSWTTRRVASTPTGAA